MLNSALLQQRAFEQYQRVQTQTATPGQLVVMLYQGAVRFVGRARAAQAAQDFDAARVNLLRAQDIVAELMSSLNLEAGEVASNLLRLYEYMHRRLVQANIRRDSAASEEVEALLRSLLPAWEEAARQQAQTAPTPTPTAPAPIPAGPAATSSLSASASNAIAAYRR